MSENKQKINLVDGIEDSKSVIKEKIKKSSCCEFCRLNGKTIKSQNENKEGMQILSEVM